jgi:molybdate/tungstate transport system substrate-binding protein
MRYLLDPEGGLKILAGMGQPPFIPARVPSPEMKNSMPGELAVLVEAKD